MQRETSSCLLTGKGTRNCAAKLPAVLQVWISWVVFTVINSAEIWDLSQDEVITIALDKVNQSDLSVPGKKCGVLFLSYFFFFFGGRKYVPGAKGLSERQIYHRCAFLRQRAKHLPQHLGGIFCYHVAIIGQPQVVRDHTGYTTLHMWVCLHA